MPSATSATVALNLFDYDGCACLYPSMPGKSIVQIHEMTLLNCHAVRRTKYKKMITGMGSARQSWTLDHSNAERNNNGSAIKMLLDIDKYYRKHFPWSEIVLEKMLMADIYSSRPVGIHFDEISQGNEPIDLCYYEHNKLLIIYAHLHRVAFMHPFVNIDVNFFDDKDEILLALKQFYTAHCDFIPRNVTLHLNQYQSHVPSNCAIPYGEPILGKGTTDCHYEQTLRDIVKDWADFNEDGYITLRTDKVNLIRLRVSIEERKKAKDEQEGRREAAISPSRVKASESSASFFALGVSSIGCGDAMIVKRYVPA